MWRVRNYTFERRRSLVIDSRSVRTALARINISSPMYPSQLSSSYRRSASFALRHSRTVFSRILIEFSLRRQNQLHESTCGRGRRTLSCSARPTTKSFLRFPMKVTGLMLPTCWRHQKIYQKPFALDQLLFQPNNADPLALAILFHSCRHSPLQSSDFELQKQVANDSKQQGREHRE